MKHYAGIGSRETPFEVLALMSQWAERLDALGWTLRSGGATGADTAFASGVTRTPEIFIPWPGFGGYPGRDGIVCGCDTDLWLIAKAHHPAWSRCSAGAQKLHTRNVAQILGRDAKTPSKFVLCWTPRGEAGGGTGQAIRIAKAYGIPVFDLYFPGDSEDLSGRLLRGEL